jgi:hypothetical protein
MTGTPSDQRGRGISAPDCGRKHHPFDGVCAPAWTEKLGIQCSRGDCGLCDWLLCGCPCHADSEPAAFTPQTSAPAAGSPHAPVLPERTQTPAGPARAAAGPAGTTSGEDFRKRLKAAQSAHNAARLRGRFTRAPRQPGPGMIRRMPPDSDTGSTTS